MSLLGVQLGLAVGRDADVARVASILNGSDDTTNGSILLTGARGMGRTTVANAAMAALDVEPIRMLGVPSQATGDYASLVHTLTGATGHLAFGPLVPQLMQILSEVGTAPAHAAARRMLSTICSHTDRSSPLILFVDDAHSFDRASQQALAYLAHHGAGAGLRCMLTADEAANTDAFASLSRLGLQPLSASDLRILLEREVDLSLPHRVGAMLHKWSGGNPTLGLDLAHQLVRSELLGTSPIGLPMVPSSGTTSELGAHVMARSADQVKVLAVFAQCTTLPIELVNAAADCPQSVVDSLVSADWLSLHQRTVAPRRRADALFAWASLTVSAQQELNVRLGTLLSETGHPEAADYFAAYGGDREAAGRLIERARDFYYLCGNNERAAATTVLVTTLDPQTTSAQDLLLAQLLAADGYLTSARSQVRRIQGIQDSASRVPLMGLLADLAAFTADPAEALPEMDLAHPPQEALDDWLRAIFTICRVQLALDGPEDSRRLVQSVQPLICHSSAAISALNDVVIAELDVYAEKPDAPAALHAAIGAWAPKRASGFDLSTISAVLDLLSLGFIGEARDLLLTASSTRQLTFTTERSAYLVARVEGEIAAGHYQRAAASLVELDREYPCSSGADLMITSQAIRINAACGDPDDVQVIERRLARSSGAVLTYPARGAHAAAQGFRQLVLGNYRESRDLLSLALHGPALLLQGRTCALADLVEAAVADGDRADALAMLDQHSSWLPDIDGDRAAGLIARCRALVADPSEIDRMFATALDQHGTTHEVDRARTLVAYGRSLMAADRGAEAARPLGEAIATFRQGRLFGWERHAHTLLEQSRSFGVRDPSWPLDQLNEMERQILALVLQRKRNREIAASLFVSLRTVEGHLTRLFRKFGVSTKAQLLRQVAADHETGREPA